jgi:hypothetical protein
VPRSCTLCEHPKREEIDRALVGETSNLSISSVFGVSESAVRRHKANHLPATLAKAHGAGEAARGDNLLEQVGDLQRRALGILDRAEEAGELKTALSAIREARGNLELLAKLLGELDERPVVNLNVSPEWLELRTVIVSALEPHPDARESVLRAIEGSPNGAA